MERHELGHTSLTKREGAREGETEERNTRKTRIDKEITQLD